MAIIFIDLQVKQSLLYSVSKLKKNSQIALAVFHSKET